jgi:hypothetical protein
MLWLGVAAAASLVTVTGLVVHQGVKEVDAQHAYANAVREALYKELQRVAPAFVYLSLGDREKRGYLVGVRGSVVLLAPLRPRYTPEKGVFSPPKVDPFTVEELPFEKVTAIRLWTAKTYKKQYCFK